MLGIEAPLSQGHAGTWLSGVSQMTALTAAARDWLPWLDQQLWDRDVLVDLGFALSNCIVPSRFQQDPCCYVCSSKPPPPVTNGRSKGRLAQKRTERRCRPSTTCCHFKVARQGRSHKHKSSSLVQLFASGAPAAVDAHRTGCRSKDDCKIYLV